MVRKPGTTARRRRREPTPFARNLSQLMKDRALSLRAVADMAGVGVSSVADWLNNSSPTDYMKVARLAQRLGIGFEWLLTGLEAEPPRAPLRLEDFFEEESTEIEGLWRIKAVKIRRKDGR